ncbi:MAG: hypothetical protein J0H12_03380 [Candidatus Paracaedimonas acanthamoebae]|uniref:Lipoprotein n=1 Tax=Candidatus Paracaedimonas acanthamoebae TaxID=244581 RepID=A0A8J7Q0L7_9PROT|nr:hypothetical protein [Candidatus Paracaedimonas acanthamoebae]
MNHILKLSVLASIFTLSGCAYEINRPVYTPSCDAQRSNCLLACRESHFNNMPALEACHTQCERNFTICLQPAPVIVEHEAPVVVETDPALAINPYPVYYGGWRSHNWWHPHYHPHFRRR